VVWPGAEVKVFLEAPETVRAGRRQAELEQKNISAEFTATLEQMRRRDERDSRRTTSPLKPAADAVIIDTGPLTAEQVIGRVLELVEEKSREAKG
jgi:cytidylate kinase